LTDERIAAPGVSAVRDAAFPPPAPLPPPKPPKPPRVRRSLAIAFTVIFVAWSCGLGGALVGSYIANRRDEPPRAASQLGIETAPARDEPYASIDVARVAEAIGPSVVAIQ